MATQPNLQIRPQAKVSVIASRCWASSTSSAISPRCWLGCAAARGDYDEPLAIAVFMTPWEPAFTPASAPGAPRAYRPRCL